MALSVVVVLDSTVIDELFSGRSKRQGAYEKRLFLGLSFIDSHKELAHD